MKTRNKLAVTVAAATVAASYAIPADAAPVSAQRLLNARSEPQNWLLVNQDYSNWRHSALTQITKNNVGQMVPLFQFSIGGYSDRGAEKFDPGYYGRYADEATPLVEAGFMYIPDALGKVAKIDVRGGRRGDIVWRFDPKVSRARTQRGVALLNDSVYIGTHDMRLINIDQNTGEPRFDVNATALPVAPYGTPSVDTQGFTTQPTALVTAKGKELILVGEATGGTRGTISWVGAWDPKDGKLAWRWYSVPFPGEPGHETWKNDAWRTGGGGVWSTPAFDPVTNVAIYGTGDSWPSYDPEFRPGDNLYTVSTVAIDVDTGKLKWYFQATPSERWDLDTINARMLYNTNAIGNVARRVAANFERQGFYYAFDLDQSAKQGVGAFLRATQYVDKVTWTAGIDPKSGKPLEYDPNKVVQQYREGPARNKLNVPELHCPDFGGAPTYFPATFDPQRRLHYAAVNEGCRMGTFLQKPMEIGKDYVGQGACCFGGQAESVVPSIVAMNVDTGQRVMKTSFPTLNESGLLSTAGGVIFTGHTDGMVTAYDADTLGELWSYSVGTPIKAPPITYSVAGKQYVAILVGGLPLLASGIQQLASGPTVVVFGLR